VDVGSPVRMKDRNITSVLSIYAEPVSCSAQLQSMFERIHIHAIDDDEQDLQRHFSEAISFIHRARMSGGNCLVHCIGGVSRSSTLVIAYVMTLTGWPWRKTFECIKGHHLRTCPNGNFQTQLKEFEKKSPSKNGSREYYRRTLLNGDKATEADLAHLAEGKLKFDEFVNGK